MATVYIREDGTGDYTTLSAALTANETDIEIHGVWLNHEDSSSQINDDNVTIEAFGAARHPGYVGNAPTHYRLRPSTGSSGALYFYSVDNASLIGLDIKGKARGTTQNYAQRIVDCNNILLKDCIFWNDAAAGSPTYAIGIVFISPDKANITSGEIRNCIVYGGAYRGIFIESSKSYSCVFDINSCVVYNCNTEETVGNAYGGIVIDESFFNPLTVGIFNTISVGNYHDDYRIDGTPILDIDYCIDSDGSIDDGDSGAVGCLTNMNPTDDDSKSSDGDWVIFRSLGAYPDLRLAYNDYNEAVQMHTSSSGAGVTMPTYDCLDKPRESSYSCGAYQMPYIVEEDGNYDYTTLSAAVTADKINIEIWGEWDSAESAAFSIDDQYSYIEAVGNARHPGYVGSSPSHYRNYPTVGNSAFALSADNITLKGIDSKASSNNGSSDRVFDSSNVDGTVIDSCIAQGRNLTNHPEGVRFFASSTGTINLTLVNCIIYGHRHDGILIQTVSSGAVLNAYINSCTFWDNGKESSSYDNINASQISGTINVNVFNTIAVDPNSGEDYGGGGTWDIHYSIDSDNSIASRDSGGVGNLANHNETDDNSKTSDGDWVIFRDITTSPYDLRLAPNTYNEARYMHNISEHATDVMQMPGVDNIGKARRRPFNCGAFEMGVIVREDTRGDYTTLTSAVAASEEDIEIWGQWVNAEVSEATIDADYTFIKAHGSARHPGFIPTSKSHFRIYNTSSDTLDIGGDYVVIDGLDISCQSSSLGNPVDIAVVSEFIMRNCIVWTPSGINLDVIDIDGGTDDTFTFENCIIFSGSTTHDAFDFNASTSTGQVVNINSCTIYGADRGVYIAGSSGFSVTVNVFNTIVMGSFVGDFVSSGSGTVTWNIDYCIDSDGTINTEDTGAVGCLTSHNDTDDCSKSSDGDWVIFNDITTLPYDLRLCDNAYNEAIGMHEAGTIWIPEKDIEGNPRHNYDCGAYEFPSGEVCWGQKTGVKELNVRTLLNRVETLSSAVIVYEEDEEEIKFQTGGYAEFETWNFGDMMCRLTDNKYRTGKGSLTIKYKDGSSKTACEADTWNTYSVPFACSGWLKLRVEA